MTDTWATSTTRPEADTQPSEPWEEYTALAPAHTPATTLSGAPLSSKGFFRRMHESHNLWTRLAELALGGSLLFAGVAFMAGHDPKFAAALSKWTGAKF
jgi:hypothetical protein